MRIYSHQSANEVWKQAAGDLLTDKVRGHVDSRIGSTYETIHAVLEIEDPRQRWVVARTPQMNPAFALVEVIWMINGRADTGLLAHWFPKYPEFVGGSQDQYAAYGKRLRSHFEVDQLVRAYEALRSNPASRQVVLQIWSTVDDMPSRDGQARSGDIPCNVMACLLIRDGLLHWQQTLRSNDIDRGLPHNIVQFTSLQEIMAGWLGLQPGRYCHVAGSLHYYVKESARLGIDSAVVACSNTDRFDQTFEDSLASFEELASWLDLVRHAREEQLSIDLAPDGLRLPPVFMNMAWVIAADDARRFGEHSRASSLMRNCTNPIYIQLWSRWLDRQNYVQPIIGD